MCVIWNIFLFLIFLFSKVKFYHIDSLQSLLDVNKSITSPLKVLDLITSKQVRGNSPIYLKSFIICFTALFHIKEQNPNAFLHLIYYLTSFYPPILIFTIFFLNCFPLHCILIFYYCSHCLLATLFTIYSFFSVLLFS